ncbi:class I SAM-dependent methyltransferase [Haliea sp. E1-2-M8]|uniref:class I SAM-dependent methyltransferase n=1 Tax=Haliea sp. E1-2-M8 TaxID=3064706 RepID=UPI00271AE367|nr:class I SAM-dependent methyltransferase [Haliea sp. E1-2-M8]MDO8863361.1 class I SAM-dependent methyltransferase [Haliea sp. E1-2-M8]
MPVVAKNSEEFEVNRCRLCGGKLVLKFSSTVLERYSVNYFLCQTCRSLQTEHPFWLGEAYQTSSLSLLDTGAAQRNLHNLAICYFVVKLFSAPNVLDFGGGDGFLCRLLRDYEVNCYLMDSHASPVYAQGFTDPGSEILNMITAFEVVEHFSDPAREMDEIFSQGAKVVLLSTLLYEGQGEDWWYLAPETGQHVFFYGEKAMELLAARYQYDLVAANGYFLFVREASLIRKGLFRLFMVSLIRRGFRALMMLLPARGVWRDHSALQVRSSRLGVRDQA